jgi:hypothetical protein
MIVHLFWREKLMCLAFLHGEYIVYGMFLASIVAIAIAAFVGWLWWKFTSRSAIRLVIGYLFVAVPPCLISLSDASSFLWFLLSFAVASPLSFLFLLGIFSIPDDSTLAKVLLSAAVINAVVIYLKASSASRRAKLQ